MMLRRLRCWLARKKFDFLVKRGFIRIIEFKIPSDFDTASHALRVAGKVANRKNIVRISLDSGVCEPVVLPGFVWLEGKGSCSSKIKEKTG